MKLWCSLPVALAAGGLSALIAGPALAQEAAMDAGPAGIPADVQNVFNTVLFLMGGFLVMWMAAGFAMLEAGLVRSKNVSMQCLKNIGLYSIAGLMFWIVGYNLMYSGVDGGFFGAPGPASFPGPGEATLDPDANHAAASDWFFQMVFCAATASIVSGTLAERIRLWPFLLFTAILTGIIYPIVGAWQWGGGWLSELGFSDFAGSTIVHSVGGWAALTGAILLGARRDKYGPDGRVNPLPGSSIPLATLGTFILWLGWFGFNGGSQLALGAVSDAADVARIFVNTNMAAAAGVISALVVMQIVYGKVDITIALNGALAGLVAITAEPLAPSIYLTVLIGAAGGIIVVLAVPFLDRLRIDDVVGAIPVHLFAGIFGTLVVPLSNRDASFGVQLAGVASVGIFVGVATAILWLALRASIGIRAAPEDEALGLDKAEVGVEAYPEFGVGSARF